MNAFPRIAVAVTSFAMLAGGASQALADTVTINGNNNYRSGAGGEFNIVAADAGGQAILAGHLAAYIVQNGTTIGTANGTEMGTGFGGQFGFETFCVEYNEYITLPGTYQATYSTGATAGGVGGAVWGIDQVSVGTAFLYSSFAEGLLTDAFVGQGAGSGYNYTNGAARAADAATLQNAFWFLEDEISLADAGGASNVFLNLVLSRFGNFTDAKKDANGAYGVGVLNLTSNNGQTLNQSQLIMAVPDGGITLTLLGMGLGSLALFRRKTA